MKTKTEYAGFKLVNGKPDEYNRVTNYYNDRETVEKEILEGQFADGETIGLVRREIHMITETVFTASVKLDKRQL